MARTLNNEVDVLNIASLDNDIKDSFTRAMITEDVNTTSAAARRYLEGEYFIHTDRYLYKALEDIAAGTAITPDVNAEVVTVSEELVRLFAQSPEGIFEILSNVENTSVASKKYVKGSQFIWTDKKLYEATADITSGSTFVVGTNIKLADNITSQIQTLTNNEDAMLNVLGAKNLLPNNATSQIRNNVTMTVNSDGTITLSGTASTDTYFVIANRDLNFDSDSILTGAANDHIRLAAYDGNSYFQDLGNGVAVPKGAYQLVEIIIAENTDTTGVKLYPMIRPASVADDTYVPYAMTNRGLTKQVNAVALKYVDFTIPSRTYTEGINTLYEGSKQSVFGIPSTAKIVSVVNLADNYTVRTYGVNDNINAQYLRIFLKNNSAQAVTMEVPIRIFYLV